MRTDLVSRGIHSSNAAGDGVTDDRAAIQAAINWAIGNNGRYHTAKFLYFPNGTYLISDTIQSRVSTSGFSNGWRAGMIFVGQSQANTIIKLANNASGFTDPSSRKSMIITGSENPNNSSEALDGSGNEAFRHQIHNLTVDTGNGNIGAVAVDFNASNRGAVRDVLIRSGDSQKRGIIGLELRKNGDGVGPLIVKNVTIDGFDRGIRGNNSTYSSTFENLTFRNQKVSVIDPGGSMFTIRNLTSTNSVPVLDDSSNLAHVVILNANVSGGSSTNTAFANRGKLLLRDVQSSGYGTVVDNFSGGTPDIPSNGGSTMVSEFSSHSPRSLFSNTRTTTLRLPVEETPTYANNNFSDWANVENFGATKNNSSDNDGPAIQAAIDSGAKIVYFPNGDYRVSTPIYVRGSVRKIIGFESKVGVSSDFSAPEMFRFDSTGTVIFRNLSLFGKVTHNSSGTLALVHCDFRGSDYHNTSAGTGKTFLEDVISPVIRLNGPSHRLWGRQLNCEHATTEFRNDGATAWLLGFKTEREYNILDARNGSFTEIFGGHFQVSNNASSTIPCLEIENSTTSINFGIYQSAYPLVVRETRNGVTREALRNDLPTRGNGNSVPLYVSGPATVASPTFSPPAGVYNSPQTVTISSATTGATIRYTTNGSTPTSSSGTVYNGPITISTNINLQAIAYKSGIGNSPVISGTYQFQTSSVATTVNSSGNIDFGTDISSYGPRQDGQDGSATSAVVSPNRKSATLAGNAWKTFPLNYTVTANTMLSFSLQSTDAGEIVGISLDNDDNPTSGRRAFLFGGSQVDGNAHSSWAWTVSESFATGTNPMNITISVGDYFQGSVTRLGLISDDDGDASSNSTFSNFRIYEATTQPPGGTATTIASSGSITFGSDLSSYGNQDTSNSAPTISANGGESQLEGNSWKIAPIAYTVTSDTVLQVTINASDTGEILGVSLDTDATPLNSRRAFLLGGSDVNGSRYQDWSWTLSPRYTSNLGSVTYLIPVGNYFTGPVSRLGLIADDDNNASANVTFSNLKLYEDSSINEVCTMVSPVDDTYVRGGTNSSRNYGDASFIRVKASGNSFYERIGLVKFDVSGIAQSAATVKIVLPVDGVEKNSAQPISIHTLPEDNWSEDTVVWSNRPNAGSLIQTFDVQGSYIGSDIVIDVTAYVLAQRSGDQTASFMLTQPNSANSFVDFGSKEGETPVFLEITE